MRLFMTKVFAVKKDGFYQLETPEYVICEDNEIDIKHGIAVPIKFNNKWEAYEWALVNGYNPAEYKAPKQSIWSIFKAFFKLS